MTPCLLIDDDVRLGALLRGDAAFELSGAKVPVVVVALGLFGLGALYYRVAARARVLRALR